jgi:uncharacterized protein (DUF362 family)
MPPLVIVSRGADCYRTARNALSEFPLPDLRGKRVLIKPNAARMALPGNGITTHPLVVEALIDHLQEVGVRKVTIGESCIFGVNAKKAFRMTGMEEISRRKGVELVDLDRAEAMTIPIPQGKLLTKIKVSAVIKEIDLIISVPVMKTHMHTGVTLSIKNMKGILWRREKARLHHLPPDQGLTRGFKELDVAISEMSTVLLPHLSVIDGTVGMEGMGPAYGTPKRTGLVLAGDNAVATDAVASRLMGFDPEQIAHLKLCAEKGMGEVALGNLEIRPRDYLKWETPFEGPPSKLSFSYPDILVYDQGSCSACLSTLLVFLQKYQSKLSPFYLEDGKVHIAIGKHVKDCPEGTLFIGNCTLKHRGRGLFVQGCPPVASTIMKKLSTQKEATKKPPKI